MKGGGGGGSKGGGRVVGEVWNFQGGVCRHSRGGVPDAR